MAIKLSSHKCIDCSGLLEFNKEEKRFECPYCGKIYEKDYQFEKVQIDGMASTNDVIRATLLNIASNELDEAKKNLLEAEKINYDYIGTKLAGLAYYRFLSFTADDASYNQIAAKIKFYKSSIEEIGDVDENESNLISFLKNSEIYAVLYIALISCGLSERAEYVANYLEFDKIINQALNKYMLKITLQFEAYNEADMVLSNLDLIDKKYSLYLVLKYYPDNDKKTTHIENLFKSGALSYKDSSIVTKYLDETSDNALTKLSVVVNALTLRMQLSISDLLRNVISEVNDSSVIEKVFKAVGNIKLSDEDTEILVDYLFGTNVDSKDVVINGLDSLKHNGSLFEIPTSYVIHLLRDSSLDASDMVEVLEYIFTTFKLSQKSKELLVDFALNEYKDEEARLKVVPVILRYCNTITLNALTNYTISKYDGENKLAIYLEILNIPINKVYFSNLLSTYVNKSSDSFDLTFKMIKVLSKYDNVLVDDAYKKLLLKVNTIDELNYIHTLKLNLKSDVLDFYLNNKTSFSNAIIDKLLGVTNSVSCRMAVKFLLSDYTNGKYSLAINILNIVRDNCFNDSYSCKYLGDSITCNFIQYYFFVSSDDFNCKLGVLKKLQELKVKLSDNMIVNQKKLAFKKYIVSHKQDISEQANRICEEMSVYKLFF